MDKYMIAILFFLIFLLSCKSNKNNSQEVVRERLIYLYDQNSTSFRSNKKKYPTLNFNLRSPAFIIIHHTKQKKCEETVKKFYDINSQVSAHYLICRDGTTIQFVEDFLRAWHAGVGKWGNITDMNSVSVGIELENSGYETFSKRQIRSLIKLLKELRLKHKILPSNILGHSDIAPSRKEDPNCHFPWYELYENGLTIMPDSNLSTNLPSDFDYLEALKKIGYNTNNPKETVQAFRKHFIGCDALDSWPLSTEELMILNNVSSKYWY